MVIGIGSYVETGRTSVTALIPAFFGAAFLLLAYVARNEAARKHAMHVALVVALVGIAGTASRLIGFRAERSAAPSRSSSTTLPPRATMSDTPWQRSPSMSLTIA